MSFTHLQIRSGYSFFQSTVQIDSLVKRAKELDFSALALTDEAVLHAVIPFYQACQKANIKPIIGMALTVVLENVQVDCILLAKNNAGYEQLIKISTKVQIEKTSEFTELLEQTDDVMCILSADPFLVEDASAQFINNLQQTFTEQFPLENIYFGLTALHDDAETIMESAKQIAAETNVKFVALHDVRYVMEEDAIGFDCLQAMKAGNKWDGEHIQRENTDRYLCSPGEMMQRFSAWDELIKTTKEIADQCNVTFSFTEKFLPVFPVPSGETSKSVIRTLCEEQVGKKYKGRPLEVESRLEKELAIIDRLGFNDYFLIVADFVQYAKRENIMVGPGRGSAAGSLVAYLLGITDVDPLAYDLLFERFLNPERVTLPDIDIDFSDRRREEVIHYVREKYGKAYVAQIITFGTFAARSVLRELMKVMQIHENDQTYILKYIPTQSSKTIIDHVQAVPELKMYIKQSAKLRTLFNVAIKLEGLPRHSSTHAAGIVIGSRPLIQDVPLTEGSQETYVTQYAMDELEAIGLLKMDILGLRNLTLIEQIVQSIQRRENKQFTLADIPTNDEKTFRLLQQGKTNGVFQFESAGMKQELQALKPATEADIIALNALYRPGPMEHIDTFNARKNGREKVRYLHPDLEPILNETYGVLVYQEQIMQVAHKFANFSLGEADLLRRAISRKDQTEMEKQKQQFIAGCLENHYERSIAEELFRWIVQFANYGFNKSHSVAYSKIAYQLAYLKANYPTYFFASLLSSVISDSGNKQASYIREASEFGISILPPSINDSFAYYTAEKTGIRIGLMAIKGIGYETVKTVLEARKEARFTDLYDFCLRVSIKRNAIETFILAGAFDTVYANRASLLATVTPALERRELFGGHVGGSLFEKIDQMNASYIEMEDFTLMQKLTDEKELLHMYVSNHPLREHRAALTINKYQSLFQVSKSRMNSQIRAIVFLQKMKKINTKRGDSMAFLTLSDETREMDAVLFPDVYRDVSPYLDEDVLYEIEGRVSERQQKKQIIINRIRVYTLEELVKNTAKILYIKMTSTSKTEALAFLREISRTYPGNMTIILYDATNKQTYQLSEQYQIDCSAACLEEIKRKFGTKNVVIKG